MPGRRDAAGPGGARRAVPPAADARRPPADRRAPRPRGRRRRGSAARPGSTSPTERTGADPAPTMLFIHGGGWMYGDLESHDAACRFLAEQSGVQLLAIDYRLAPEHTFPAAVEDCQAAYRWLVDHAEDVNADPAGWPSAATPPGGSLVAVDRGVGRREGPADGLPAADLPRRRLRRAHREPAPVRRGLRARPRSSWTAPRRPTSPTDADKSDPDASGCRRVDFPAGLAPAHVVTAGFDPLRDEGEALRRAAGGERRRGDLGAATRR